jgi:D-alanyl-D-alanine carboxypeptidase/D-alanyl-D-alanine-endopeptidase (penicillin-binding protein 4)
VIALSQIASVTPAAAAAPDPGSASKVTTSVKTQMSRFGGSAGAFCYAVENGSVQGYNQDKPVRIASVMKLMTTLWAVETLGPNYRFTTRIFIQPSNHEMHIAGSRDPFFDRQRLFLLLADLNKLGYKHMNRITADRNVRFDLQALDFTRYWKYAHTTSHAGTSLAARDIKSTLTDVFNTAQWSTARKQLYVNLAANSKSPKLPAGVVFKADAVDVVPSNPLAGKPGVLTFEIKSAPIKTYIKQMNILSVNPLADEIFATLGGPDAFRRFMQDKHRMGEEFAKVYTGSGLPLNAGGRRDTMASCSSIILSIRRLDRDLESQGMDLSDVMMVAGVDTQPGATFSDASRALIVKTGTVNSAKNLAGVAETTAGEVYFGIFLQGPSAHSWNVRSALTKMMANFRTKRVTETASSFDPLDSKMQLAKVDASSSAGPELRRP